MAGNYINTYGDTSIREDVVLNAVEILTAQETQVSSMFGRSTAIATVHSYLTDTLNRILGVYKFSLIDLDAAMQTGRKA